MTQNTVGGAPRMLSVDERSAKLSEILRSDTQNGWRVISQTPTSAQLEKGKHTNHVLHLILTIITIGLWGIVWIIVALGSGQKQRYVAIDEYGNISRT